MPSLILKTAARYLPPLLLLFSVFVLLRDTMSRAVDLPEDW